MRKMAAAKNRFSALSIVGGEETIFKNCKSFEVSASDTPFGMLEMRG